MRRTTAIARIVVQATAQDKKAIAAKAKRFKLPISELMRRGAFAYEPNEADEELGALADSAKAAAERAGAAIDDALEFIAASLHLRKESRAVREPGLDRPLGRCQCRLLQTLGPLVSAFDSSIRRYASWDFAGPVGFTPHGSPLC